MAFFCNFCTFIPENKSTVSLIGEESNINKVDDSYQSNKNESMNKKRNIYSSKKLYQNKFSPEKDNNGNSIFEQESHFICIFCGGESCKYENPSKEIISDIDGLIANLYFDCVYASQRPCTKLINEYNLIKIFKEKRIKLIVNCQINGEHPYCGPNKGLEKDSGFSYSPSIFISEGIEVLCKGFRDLTPPYTFNFILDIVKRMAYIIKYKNGRVLVHCHAGNGRTGIVNVCFFMFYFNYSYIDALQKVRKLRKKGVEKPDQELYCKKFGEYIKSLKDLFPNKTKKICDFVMNQNIIDYNFDKDKTLIPSIVISYFFKNCEKNKAKIKEIYKSIIDINFIPKIIFECIEKIVGHLVFNNISLKDLYYIINGKEEINEEQQSNINSIIRELKKFNWELFEKQKDLNVISEIFFIWLNKNIFYCISPQKIEKIMNDFIELYLPEKEAIPSTMNDKESINRILINNIQKLSEKYIDNQKYKDETKKMVISIKIYLTKVEYEIVKYLSLFLQIIYPKNQACNLSNIQTNENNIDKELVYEYKRFLYKLSLFLLGYNLDKINYNPDYSIPSIELLHSKMLIFIFELIIFYCFDGTTSDFSKEEDIYFMYKNKVDFHSLKKYL